MCIVKILKKKIVRMEYFMSVLYKMSCKFVSVTRMLLTSRVLMNKNVDSILTYRTCQELATLPSAALDVSSQPDT